MAQSSHSREKTLLEWSVRPRVSALQFDDSVLCGSTLHPSFCVARGPPGCSGWRGPRVRAALVVSLSIRLNGGHAAHLIKDGRRSHSRRITMSSDGQTGHRTKGRSSAVRPTNRTPSSFVSLRGVAKAKFHYVILVADRSEAGRRLAASWNLAYHLARHELAGLDRSATRFEQVRAGRTCLRPE